MEYPGLCNSNKLGGFQFIFRLKIELQYVQDEPWFKKRTAWDETKVRPKPHSSKPLFLRRMSDPKRKSKLQAVY